MKPPAPVDARRPAAADFASHPLLGQDGREGVGRWIAAWRHRVGAAPERIVQTTSILPLVGMAVSGLGVTYLAQGLFPEPREKDHFEVLGTECPLPSIACILLRRSDEGPPRPLTAPLDTLVPRCCDLLIRPG